MRIPKMFLPEERNLDVKVGELMKSGRKVPKFKEHSDFKDIHKRVAPIFEKFIETVYSKNCGVNIELEKFPYSGWIDFFDGPSNSYYCAIFDSRSEQGIELDILFKKSCKRNGEYDYRPKDSFYRTVTLIKGDWEYDPRPEKSCRIEGRVIDAGYTNDFWWYFLKVIK